MSLTSVIAVGASAEVMEASASKANTAMTHLALHKVLRRVLVSEFYKIVRPVTRASSSMQRLRVSVPQTSHEVARVIDARMQTPAINRHGGLVGVQLK